MPLAIKRVIALVDKNFIAADRAAVNHASLEYQDDWRVEAAVEETTAAGRALHHRQVVNFDDRQSLGRRKRLLARVRRRILVVPRVSIGECEARNG